MFFPTGPEDLYSLRATVIFGCCFGTAVVLLANKIPNGALLSYPRQIVMGTICGGLGGYFLHGASTRQWIAAQKQHEYQKRLRQQYERDHPSS